MPLTQKNKQSIIFFLSHIFYHLERNFILTTKIKNIIKEYEIQF